jgi:hypothetical protein
MGECEIVTLRVHQAVCAVIYIRITHPKSAAWEAHDLSHETSWSVSKFICFVCLVFFLFQKFGSGKLGGPVKGNEHSFNNREENGQEDRLRLCNFWIGTFPVHCLSGLFPVFSSICIYPCI